MTMRETGRVTEILETWAESKENYRAIGAFIRDNNASFLKKKNAMHCFVYTLRLFILIVAYLGKMHGSPKFS